MHDDRTTFNYNHSWKHKSNHLKSLTEDSALNSNFSLHCICSTGVKQFTDHSRLNFFHATFWRASPGNFIWHPSRPGTSLTRPRQKKHFIFIIHLCPTRSGLFQVKRSSTCAQNCKRLLLTWTRCSPVKDHWLDESWKATFHFVFLIILRQLKPSHPLHFSVVIIHVAHESN